MPKVASKTRKKRVEKKTSVAVTSSTDKPSSKRRTKRSKKDENAEVESWQNKKRKIERKIKNTEAKVKKTKRSTKKTGDYRNILEYKSDKDMRNVEKRLRERLKKKRQEEVDEEEELLKSTSESSHSSSESNSNSDSSSGNSSSSSSKKLNDENDVAEEDEDVKEALDCARRASIIASSNVNPSDGDDEGSKSGTHSTKESDAGGSLDSNRSHLSSNSKKSSLTRARNAAAKKEAKNKKESSNKESKEFAEYDQIERQLLADQEKELEYLNGLDQPINKADLPLLCPDENHNGPPMNEPMKLRIQRLKRTKIWVRNIPTVKPMLRDEVDEYIDKQKKKKEQEQAESELQFESIFDPPSENQLNEKTLEMESNLKLAILKRLNQQQT